MPVQNLKHKMIF